MHDASVVSSKLSNLLSYNRLSYNAHRVAQENNFYFAGSPDRIQLEAFQSQTGIAQEQGRSYMDFFWWEGWHIFDIFLF